MLAERISDKLASVHGLMDRELYGPGYVAFREAERLRRTADDPVAALVKHERLRIEQPGVVFASAARGAIVKCLLQLALLPAKERPLSSYRDGVELRLRNLKAAFASLTLFQAVPAAVTEAKAAIDRWENELRQLNAVPTGAFAASQALALVQHAFTHDLDDPYVGEMLYDMGIDGLERSASPEQAKVWLTRTLDWCGRTSRNINVAITLMLSDATKKVSAPPPNERKSDGWGNTLCQGPKVGDLFNPLTCDWYLIWLERNTRVYYGLCYFSVGDNVAAKKQWEQLLKIDDALAVDEGIGRGSLYNHLIWDAENNGGALYATPEEMATFTYPTLRMAVLLADLEYEAEQHPKALKRYEAILVSKQWTLSESQRAYILYALANCQQYVDHSPKRAIATLSVFLKEYRHAPTRPRALYGLGNLNLRNPSPENEQAAENAYATLMGDYPDNAMAVAVPYILGWYYRVNKKPVLAIRWLKVYLAQNPQGRHAELTRGYIAELSALKP
jgi:tetratricopeptide (TPR) repeat protein